MKNKKLLIIGSIPKGLKGIGGVTVLTKNFLDFLNREKIKYSQLSLYPDLLGSENTLLRYHCSEHVQQ